jgi:hypothetical protein
MEMTLLFQQQQEQQPVILSPAIKSCFYFLRRALLDYT